MNFRALGALCCLASLYVSAGVDSKKDNVTSELDRVICKNLPVSGSHRKQRICRTKLEWDESRKRSRGDAQYEQKLKRTTSD